MPMLTTSVKARPVLPRCWPLRTSYGKGTHAGQLGLHQLLHGRLPQGAASPWCTGGAAQGHMQHGPLLGGIDDFAAEHGFALAGHTGLLGQGQQLFVSTGAVHGLTAEVQPRRRCLLASADRGGAAGGVGQQRRAGAAGPHRRSELAGHDQAGKQVFGGRERQPR
jgi:hypothetical protein